MLEFPRLLHSSNSLGEHRPQHIAMLTVEVYYSKRTQSKISKDQRCSGCSLEGTGGQLQGPLSVEPHRPHLISPTTSCGNTHGVSSPREALQRLSTQGWSRRSPLSGMYQDSRLPKGEWIFSINHNVHTNSLGRVSHSCQGMVKTLLRSKFQDASQGPTFQVGLFRDSSLRPDKLSFFFSFFLQL